MHVQTNYNEVVVSRQGGNVLIEKVTGSRKLAQKVNTHIRDREMSGKMKRIKSKKEVQVITFNYFAQPQPRDLNLFM